MDNLNISNGIRGNRLCLDFANLAGFPGQASVHPLSWTQLIEFLAQKNIVSADRAEKLHSLPESDLRAAENLLVHAERLAKGIRASCFALTKNASPHSEWVEPINEVLRVTEGHDQLARDGNGWRVSFMARDEGLDWLLAAVARSAAEVIAAGRHAGLRRCGNPRCELLFYDDSKSQRRRWCSMALCGNRHKVAQFARRHSGGKARAHHA